jgi:hypothetical protein
VYYDERAAGELRLSIDLELDRSLRFLGYERLKNARLEMAIDVVREPVEDRIEGGHGGAEERPENARVFKEAMQVNPQDVPLFVLPS